MLHVQHSIGRETAVAKAKLYLKLLIQDSQDYGSNDEHMVSRVFFDLEVDGKMFQDLHADVKQTVGSSFETAPLEVFRPAGYKGPFNHEAFQQIIERYYRSLVGGKGSGIHIAGGSNIRMRNNRFAQAEVAEFEVQVAGGSW